MNIKKYCQSEPVHGNYDSGHTVSGGKGELKM